MNDVPTLLKATQEIEAKINYHFNDIELLVLAFTHRSYVNESRVIVQHNERLEFLGDAILGMIASSYLYKTHPQAPEGDLSALRARLVEASSCVIYIQKLDLEKYLLLGKGERMNDGRGRETILSDLFEALIGAIYLDGGIQVAEDFFLSTFEENITAILQNPLKNSKALLQDYCQKKFQCTPHYYVLDEHGPDHSKLFRIVAKVHDKELGYGEGASKKEAQQAAAHDSLTRLQEIDYGS